MLIESGAGFDFTAADFDTCCREIGFRRAAVLHLSEPSAAAIADN